MGNPWAIVPSGVYPREWREIANRVKAEAGWRCVRCGRPHDADPRTGNTLTVHHLTGDKSDCRWWNLLPLCQRCHLSIQRRVDPERPWILEHSEWFKPFVAGFYATKYLGWDLTREETEARLDELLALEARSVIGADPIPVEVR
jgi:hypothetical protein